MCRRRKLWGLLMTHAVLLTVPIHHTPLHTKRHTLQSSVSSTNKYTRTLKDEFPFFQHRGIKFNIEYLKWNNNHLKPDIKHFDNQRYKVTIYTQTYVSIVSDGIILKCWTCTYHKFCRDNLNLFHHFNSMHATLYVLNSYLDSVKWFNNARPIQKVLFFGLI